MPDQFEIAGRVIGPSEAPYIIAEVSANHNGSINRARKTILAARDAGAHAVKIQTYTADTLTIDCDKDDFLIKGGLWDGYTLYDLYKEAHTPFEWHEELFAYARQLGITLFSTPFDESAVDLLDHLDAPAMKIASFEMTDLPLVRYAAKTGRPMLMSTGMATLEEVGESVEAARSAGCNSLLLFHCISSYPAPKDQANVSQMQRLAEEFGVAVGLSDHTIGNTAAITATALGAHAIEKHFTLSRADKGPDSAFSLEPGELRALVTDTRDAWLALGTPEFTRTAAEDASKVFRRSVYFMRNMQAGAVITDADIRRIRPGNGLAPKHYDDLIGRTITRNVERGDPVTWDDVSG